MIPFGSGPTVHLYPDRAPITPRRRSSSAPLLLGLGIPAVLLALGGLLLLSGDQPTKPKRGKRSTTPAVQQAPAPQRTAPARVGKPPATALGKPTAAPTLSPAEEKAEREAWRKREKEMLEQERKMIEKLGD